MVILVVDLELFDLGVGGVGLGVWCGGCGGGGIKKSVFQVWVGVVGRIMVISAVDLELFVLGNTFLFDCVHLSLKNGR